MRQRYVFLFFVLLLSLCSQVVAAGKETLQLEYVASNAKIVDVINNSSIHWQTTDDKVLNLGYSNLSYWVRTSLNIDEKEGPYLLEIAYPVLDQLDVYMLQEGNIFVHQQLGDKQPFVDRPFAHEHFIIPLPNGTHGKVALYIKVRSSSALQLPVVLWTNHDFLINDQVFRIVMGIYFGLMGIMAAYNVLLYFTIRESTLFYYVLYVICLALFSACLSGFAFRYLWPNSLWWNDQAILFFLISSVLTGTYFVMTLLEIGISDKWLYLGCRLILGLGLVLLFSSVFFDYAVMIKLTIAYAVSACIWGVFCRILRLAGKSRLATYYSIAWSSVLIGGIILALNKLDLISQTWFTENALLIGTAIEVACLSIAIGEKLNTEKNKRFQAQLTAFNEIQKVNSQLEKTVAIRTQALQEANDRLELASRTDALTGVANRRALDEALHSECLRAKRFEHALSVIMIDIDFFKQVNDTYGHEAGDDCLIHIGRILSNCATRAGDFVARYGGEEFCIVLAQTDSSQAFDLAEKIRMTCETSPLISESYCIEMTLSAGLHTQTKPPYSGKELLASADQALYFAKRNGRNQVAISGEL